MSAKKVVNNKVAKIAVDEMYKAIFAEGTRLNMNPLETKQFLQRKFLSCVLTDCKPEHLRQALEFLKKQKALSDYSLDEIAAWRNTARKRLFENEQATEQVCAEMARIRDAYLTRLHSLEKKHEADVRWYKKLGKVLAAKVKGIRFADDELDVE
jgi:ribosomal 50S subunit-associated protein YjgA (DUF615 family)